MSSTVILFFWRTIFSVVDERVIDMAFV